VIPYASFLYFAVAALYVFLPVALMRTIRASAGAWWRQAGILAATAIMLAIQYSGQLDPNIPSSLRQIWAVLFYAAGQYLVAAALLAYRQHWRAKWPGYVAVALALGPLLAAKFLPLNAAISAAGPAGAPGATGLVEFIGLSYATLRAIDVLIEIHDGLIKTLSPGQFFAFLVFFPTVSSGPIDRFRRFAADWQAPLSRTGFFEDLDGAVHRIFTGFFYKFIVAHIIYGRWLKHIPANPTWGHSLSYMYGYSAYLFFDFAGYSAFAIGFSYLLGVHTPENFAWPFLSRNIREFWTRWHITLSFWFRDFVYMRFLLFVFKTRGVRHKHAAAYLANLLTFGLMGFWHGTEARYLIYGVYHAALVTGHDLFARWNKPHPDQPPRLWGDSWLWQAAGMLVTLHAVCFGFLIFSGRRFY
jgi:membrane protein involved in D-alanine export